MGNDPTDRKASGRGPMVVLAMAVLMIGGAGLLTYLMHVSTSELVRNLDSSDTGKVSYDLEILKDRHDPAGIEKALALLKSDNVDVAASAAIYLGAMGRSEAITYLIKALPLAEPVEAEEAARKQEIVGELTELTKQSFGSNVGAWRKWGAARESGE